MTAAAAEQVVALPALFDESHGVCAAALRFDERDVAPAAGVDVPAALAGAVRKRRAEFVAGRRAAQLALAALAPALGSAQVGIGPRREPVWPAGVRGAITHAAGLAAAVVGWSDRVRGVGLDIEAPIAADAAAAIAEKVLTPGERARLFPDGWNDPEARRRLTLAFSAKESVFKSLHAEVGRYFDFLDAELLALTDAGWRLRLMSALGPALPAGFAVDGRHAAIGALVATAVVIPRLPTVPTA
jgi:enterobactin synthetase component D